MIELISVPYDSGQRSFRMGRGPEHLLECGLVARLEANGAAVQVTTLETASADQRDSAFDLARQIAAATQAAVQRDHFPVILAGNCIASVGGFAGVESRTAVLWLDAHAGFNTPETSPSGFLDGMTLAVITGRSYREQSRSVAGFQPLVDSELVMLGVRSIDEGERAIVNGVSVAQTEQELSRAVSELQRAGLYVHVDLDVLDPSSLRANQFATPGGLTTDSLIACIAEAARAKPIAAMAIAAYDPSGDAANTAPGIVAEIIAKAQQSSRG
jgi:arginase